MIEKLRGDNLVRPLWLDTLCVNCLLGHVMFKAATPILLISSLVATAPGALVITEYMANPAALSDADGEYFEVYNSGPDPISVSTLTLKDDGSNSIDLLSSTATIPVGEFFVFGSSAQAFVDFSYGGLGTFQLGNSGDEIVVATTSDSADLARLNYDDGDPAGSGIALVLNSITNASGGVSAYGDFMAEVAANDTLDGDDIGSPGAAGSTAIPEPSTALLGGLALLALIRRRR